MCMLLMIVSAEGILSSAYEISDIDFQDAVSIDCGTIYRVSVEGNGEFALCSFEAPESGYYLFEALGDLCNTSIFNGNRYYEPVAALYDSNKNEIQYVEFDQYYPEIKNNAPYAKMVQWLKKGEICYYKTALLDPEMSGTYIIRVISSPDLVFTYSSSDEYEGYYELYRYAGTSKDFTLNGSYIVSTDESLYTPLKNIPLNVIGLGAFEGNEYLENITLSYDIDCIASEAFLNCKNLRNVNLGKNVFTIGYRAFAGCDSLKSITIECDDVILEPQCLGYDENGNKYSDFIIICNENSAAEEYAKANGINYTLLKSEPIKNVTSKTSMKSSATTTTTTMTKITTAYNTVPNVNIVKIPKVKRASIKKVYKTSKKKRLKIKWKKISNVSGYQIKCGLNKKMTKGKKVILTKTNGTSKTVKGLKSKKIYYIKVRAYKTYRSENGEMRRSYGKWSKIKKARTR